MKKQNKGETERASLIHTLFYGYVATVHHGNEDGLRQRILQSEELIFGD